MGLVIEVKVIPNSKKQSFCLEQGGLVKCTLKSKPEKNKANEELIKLLSKTLHIPQQDIKIMSGYTSKKKLIKLNVDNFTLSDLYTLCNVPMQAAIK